MSYVPQTHVSVARPLLGRTALVTGAAGDFGRAAAMRLAGAGAALVVADHPSGADRRDATAGACRPSVVACEEGGVRVADAAATRVEIEEACADFSVPDLVFNNAGFQDAFGPDPSYPLDDAARVIDVNVIGALNVMASAAAAMVGAGVGGAIVNTASMAGVSGAPNMVAYSASKAVIVGMTESAAKDLAPTG